MPSCTASAAESLAVTSWSDKDEIGGRLPGDLAPGLQQDRQILLGVQAAGEDDPGPRQQLGLDDTGSRVEMVCVHAADGPDQTVLRNTQVQPLALDFL